MKNTIFSFAFLSVISCNYPKEYSSYEDSKEQCSHRKKQKEILCYFKGFEMSEIEKLVIEEQDNENKVLTKISDFYTLKRGQINHKWGINQSNIK